MKKRRSNKPRWQRLGLQESSLRAEIESIEKRKAKIGRYADNVGPGERGRSSDWGRQRDLLAYYEQLQTYHLEFPGPFDKPDQLVRTMSQLAVEYFFGDWHDTVWHESGRKLSRDQCRKKLDWIDEFRLGMMAALLARRAEDQSQLARYPDTDLPTDDGGWERTKEDNQFFIILARFIRDGDLSDCKRLITALNKSRKRRPRLLLHTLLAIVDGKEETACQQLGKYMRLFASGELDLDTRVVTSLEGSILWNLADISGLALSELDEPSMDLIMTHESLNLNAVL